MMRLAELVDAGALGATIDRSWALGGTKFGCAALGRHAERLRDTLEPLPLGAGPS